MGNEVSSSLSSSLQMLSNARNVNIADESTLSAVGGNVYNVAIDTIHNLEPALDGEFSVALHDELKVSDRLSAGKYRLQVYGNLLLK
jgi:hypothetical protein